jgi:hypothetical protein
MNTMFSKGNVVMIDIQQKFSWGNESIKLCFVPPKQLKPTEIYNKERTKALARKIFTENYWTRPLLVESNHLVIMDGHHRHQAAMMLNLMTIPCIMLSYESPYLEVSSWRNKPISKEEIIHAGLTGKLLEYKSTRHKLLLDLPKISIPIRLLYK